MVLIGGLQVNAWSQFDVLLQPLAGTSLTSRDVFNSIMVRSSGTLPKAYSIRVVLNRTTPQVPSAQVAVYEIDRIMLNGGLVPLRNISAQLVYRTTYFDAGFQTYITDRGFFPAGDYNVCVQVIALVENAQVERCNRFVNRSYVNLKLVTPTNFSTVATSRPLFTWLYSAQAASTRYCFKLFEEGENETPEQAVLANHLVHQVCNLSQPILQYPVEAAVLDSCKKYVWKVDVIEGGVFQLGSEVWQFRTNCDSLTRPKHIDQIYASLSNDLSGATYGTERWLCFQNANDYKSLEGIDLTLHNMDMSIAETTIPVDELRNRTGFFNGINMYCLDLNALGIPKGSYILQLKNQKFTYYLKVKYRN
jgi:hypothetical protein